MRQKKILLWSLFFTCFFTLLAWDKILSEDMAIHHAFINRNADSSLYVDDYIFKVENPQLSQTIYYPLLAKLVVTGYESLSFKVIYGFVIFVFCSGVFLLTQRLGLKFSTGVFFLALLGFRFQIGGSAVSLLETQPLPRLLSLSLIIWGWYFFLDGKKALCYVTIIFASTVHPLSFFYFLLLICLNKILGQRRILKKFLIPLTGLSLLVLYAYFSTMSRAWLSVIRMRNSYAFIDLWSLRDWFNLVILLVPGLVLPRFHKFKPWIPKVFRLSLYLAIGASAVNVMFSSLYPLQKIVILQLGRLWLWPVYISFLILADYFVIRAKTIKLKAIVFVIISCLVAVNYARVSRTEINKKSWMSVQLWAQKSSNATCTFLTPYYEKGFRTFSKRGIIIEHKDGALVFYSSVFASDWLRRSQIFSTWEEMPTLALLKLQKEFGFDYIVDNSATARSLPIVFSSGPYTVYDVRNQGKCT